MWRQIRGWFLTKDGTTHSPHEVGTDDLLELLAWAFLYKRLEEVDADEMAWLKTSADKIESEFNLDKCVRPGRSGVVSVRHTLDRIRAIHRPLLFYLGCWLLQALSGVLLRLRGFRRSRHGGLRYWHRLASRGSQGLASAEQAEAAQVSSETRPLIFFHGIGLGLATYWTLLARLPQKDQVFFEMPWIAMNPLAEIPSSEDYARWVVEVLQAHELADCVGMGHSFGTLPIAWLLRRHPGVLKQVILVDPVSIFLNLPDVCVNFLYKPPRTFSGFIMSWFGARELGIAKTLMRHFFWTDNVLFPEMLPADSSVVLMGKDGILPVRDIYTSVSKFPHVRQLVVDDMHHGQFLYCPSAMQAIMDHLGWARTAVSTGSAGRWLGWWYPYR